LLTSTAGRQLTLPSRITKAHPLLDRPVEIARQRLRVRGRTAPNSSVAATRSVLCVPLRANIAGRRDLLAVVFLLQRLRIHKQIGTRGKWLRRVHEP
jgi:hypothetical protein